MIQTDPEGVERIRERLRKMSDLELRKFGRSASVMADPKMNFRATEPSLCLSTAEYATALKGSPPK